MNKLEEPGRYRREAGLVGTTAGGPAICFPARVHARRRNDVAAVASQVEAGMAANLHRVANNLLPDGRKEHVRASAARVGPDCGGQRPVFLLECSQCAISALALIHVEDYETADCARRDAEVGGRSLSPPSADDVGVGCGVLETVGRECSEGDLA